MYGFHYNFIKRNLDAKLLLTDKDSLIYEIKSEDVYEESFKHKHLFDLSNYPNDSKFFDPTNNKVIGKMNDVYKGNSMSKFIGLKSKIRCILLDNGKESNTIKGVYIEKESKEYKDTLLNKKVIRHKMRRNQRKIHKIGTYEVNKITLSCFDDKRFVLDDGIHTLAYFQKDYKKQKQF